MRDEIRVLGIDDAPFSREDNQVLVVATFFRGNKILDGILSTKITRDGDDATEKLIKMITKSKFRHHLKAILLDGIALGGFNVIDITKLHEQTNIPIIVVMRKLPDKEKMFSALKKMQHDHKIALIEQAGEIHPYNSIFFQCCGIEKEQTMNILDLTITMGNIPEPIRVAHLIGAGIVKGESLGQA